MTDEYDSYKESQYTAEISQRMRVPDRLSLVGDSSNGYDERSSKKDNTSDYHRMMTVPDRIMIAGGNSHFSTKSTPRELQLENSFLPPTMEQIRVSTPPRSIRLEDHSFPTVDNNEENVQSPYHGYNGNDRHHQGPTMPGSTIVQRSDSVDSENDTSVSVMNRSDSVGTGLGVMPRDNLTPWEELQLVRRQIAKLNHRLMAVELENQQQQQRETILTVIMSAYFIGKFLMWIQRSL